MCGRGELLSSFQARQGFGSAHTDADTIVYFKTKKFVMLSDLVNFANASPGISGTNAVQVPGILDKVLKLDFDMAIAGRGPLLTKADVQAYQKTWDTFMTRVKDAVRAGATKETLASQVKQDDLFSPGLKSPWALNANFFGQAFRCAEIRGHPLYIAVHKSGLKMKMRRPTVLADHALTILTSSSNWRIQAQFRIRQPHVLLRNGDRLLSL
jgi:hypothetical protein